VPATAIAWRGGPGPRIFAYLKPRDPRFDAILRALRACEGETIIATPGIDPARAAALSGERMRVVARPLDLSLLAHADLCVSHGGPGMAAAAIEHGVAQAILPGQLEQYMVGQRLATNGLARVFDPDGPGEGVGAFIAGALADMSLRGAAARERGASRPAGRAAERIAAMLES